MDKSRRKELQEAYSQIKIFMGVIQIKNTVNGKIYIGAYPNLKNKWMTITAQLDMGRFANLELQKEWKEFGAGVFEYEVLEQKDAGELSDVRWEMTVMEKVWHEKLQPYGEKGYNRPLR
ncbi:GIY-YIG nuclease family protein [Gorillibacterium massiliense]|uniref:GIY-YIG nuclease family protein n=1 Tax=Gorillibacterium massiliense TaxID=1280390 RepID=UPI0004BCB655|nr:GIY-YIG nuclease family protein [Gorillibacterium massiliense]